MMNNYLNQIYPYAMDNYYQDNYYTNTKQEIPNTTTSNGSEVYNAFIRGNYFDTLYDPYKNYQPLEPTITNDREGMLEELQAYNFVLTDLNLYLDINPNDMNAINIFNNYITIYKKVFKEFEEKYGPLTIDNINKENNWQWDNSPWPWEVQK